MFFCPLKVTLVECKNCELNKEDDVLLCSAAKSIKMSSELLTISKESFEELAKIKGTSVK